ncbi:MAG: hypothetical protein ACYC54_13185 [Sedimentisphaerales bacterium]
MKKCTLIAILSVVLALAASLQGTAVVFDESLSGIGYGEDSGAGYQAGAMPDDGVTPNAMLFGFFGGVSGDITLETGKSYKITARRKVVTQAQTGFQVYLNGNWFVTDSGAAASEAEQDTFQALRYLGIFKPAADTVNVSLMYGGGYVARVDWIKFEETGEVFFDESTAGITYVGAGAGYEAGASPDDGSTANRIGLGSGTSASASLSLQVGQKYKLYARRRVLTNSNLSFYVDFDGVNYWYDSAYHPSLPDTFQEAQYLGYFLPQNASTTVTVHDGGPWVARFDYLRFEPTTDVYFDENISGISFTGGAGRMHLPGTMPIAADVNNGVGLGVVDTVSGTVNLVAGRIYNVYASRTVHDSGNLGYDISLNGVTFVHDAALLTPNDSTIESQLGQYMATNAATTVQLSNGGIWFARVDHIRFELVEPLVCGDAGTVYLPGDLEPDCKIDFKDFAAFAQDWLECTDPAQELNCN